MQDVYVYIYIYMLIIEPCHKCSIKVFIMKGYGITQQPCKQFSLH